MSYSFNLPIPISTSEASPVEVELVVHPMIAKEVRITFPSGCVGLVGVWFEYQSQQLWPYNSGGRFIGNNQEIRFSPNVEIIEPPLKVKMLGYNNDDTFVHTIYAVIDPSFQTSKIASIIAQLTGIEAPVALAKR